MTKLTRKIHCNKIIKRTMMGRPTSMGHAQKLLLVVHHNTSVSKLGLPNTNALVIANRPKMDMIHPTDLMKWRHIGPVYSIISERAVVMYTPKLDFPKDIADSLVAKLELLRSLYRQPTQEVVDSLIRQEIKEFMAISLRKDRCYVPEQYKVELDVLKKGLKLLRTTYDKMTDEEVIASLMKIGGAFYPDAIDDYGVFQRKEGEGVKIKSIAYDKFREIRTSLEKNKIHSLRYGDKDFILKSISNGDFIVGTIKEPSKALDIIALSGPLLHVVIATRDPTDSNYVLVNSMLTSSKDNTVFLADNQINVDVRNKEQRLLIFDTILRIPRADFVEHKEATTFIQGCNTKGERIVTKIIEGLQEKSKIFDNAIEEVFYFTRDSIKPIIEILLTEKIIQLETGLQNLENYLKGMADEQKMEFLEELKAKEQKSKKNQEEMKQYNEMSPADKAILNAKKVEEKMRKKVANDAARDKYKLYKTDTYKFHDK